MSISYDAADHIATITIDRPEAMNALRIEDLHALNAALIQARDDARIRCIVVTGAGGRAFCVGTDLKNSAPPPQSYAEAFFLARDAAVRAGIYTRAFDLTELNIHKPMIAAIDGHCLGGGLELALQCDLRIASTRASFGLPEVAVASIPGVGGIPNLLRAIPAAVAMRMLLTGERIDAKRAYEVGLVSDLCEPEALIATARRLAEKIAANGPLAVQMVKRLARQSADLSLTEALQATETGWGMLRDSQDRAEGRAAFAEKRKPRYSGR
jgi:E-phenylitaconyl-CoA hydratase